MGIFLPHGGVFFDAAKIGYMYDKTRHRELKTENGKRKMENGKVVGGALIFFQIVSQRLTGRDEVFLLSFDELREEVAHAVDIRLETLLRVA